MIIFSYWERGPQPNGYMNDDKYSFMRMSMRYLNPVKISLLTSLHSILRRRPVSCTHQCISLSAGLKMIFTPKLSIVPPDIQHLKLTQNYPHVMLYIMNQKSRPCYFFFVKSLLNHVCTLFLCSTQAFDVNLTYIVIPLVVLVTMLPQSSSTIKVAFGSRASQNETAPCQGAVSYERFQGAGWFSI